ncbi:hypothetical protein [Thiohalomonas denitrificans]|uniref:hypothetical protein n=1 Tax=Thiohalomonas denitrificans TaxID=415747 RepID=UPI000B88792C|nr:hypothetical protein [Thiohalomonas denitrificans]
MSRYLALLPKGKVVLWCYLIWYVVVVVHYFDPSPAIWLNALGVSAVMGVALLLSVGGSVSRANEPWQTARLFLMPFCVSSFSSLIKGKGFVLVFPPTSTALITATGSCAAFALFVALMKVRARRQTLNEQG